MDIEKEVYHSNGMLGLIPVVEESEAMSFNFGKILNSDSKDFFNCDTSIGLEYPVRSALQPICVHVDGAESTNWVNPPCDENVDLLDISSKRLPVDLGFNGLDKSSIYSSSSSSSSSSNANLTPNNHVIANSLPASELTSPETNDYYSNSQYNSDIYSMRADYSNNHASIVDNEKIYYNGNHSSPYSNGYHSQHYDHPNHHVNYDHPNHYSHHVHHLSPHQIYHQPITPLHHYQPQKRAQQPFQRHFTHRRRLNLYEKTSPSPIKHKQKQHQQPQVPLMVQKTPKHTKPQKPALVQRSPKQPKSPKSPKPPKSPKSLKTQRQKPQLDPSSTKQTVIKRKKQRTHDKPLDVKPELNQRVILKKKLGRPRKYDYVPSKPTKFRSSRLRLRVQSEEVNSEDVSNSEDQLETEVKVQVKKVKEVLPCDWIKPDNLTFDRETVSEYEKTSLPEFFAGKFDRTHFHPSQYLQIRNIFLDEWESRKPNAVHFREMIRMHKGIGNVVSFSRVCKFLTAIGAINEISQEDDDDENDDEEDEDNNSINNSKTNKDDVIDDTLNKGEDDASDASPENQSKSLDGVKPEDAKDSNHQPTLSSTSSPLPASPLTPPTPPPTQPEDNTSVNSRPRKRGRQRKSYYLNEMARLGINPTSVDCLMSDEINKEDEKDDKPSQNDQ